MEPKKRILFFLVFTGVVLGLTSIITFLLFSNLRLQLVDAKSLVNSNQILFNEQTQISPDKKYITFMTSDDLGMRGSVIWIAKSDGTNLRKLVSEDTSSEENPYDWLSNPIWSPDSKKIAYMRINPFQIWTINIDGTENKLVGDDKKIYISLGYGGKTHFRWIDNENIEFENSASFPSKLYSLNIKTKKFKEQKDNNSTVKSSGEEITLPFFYQREKGNEKEQLGSCKDETIESAGCAISSVSMILKYYGASDITLKDLNDMLKSKKDLGYVNGCDVRWDLAVNYVKNVELVASYHYDPKELMIKRLNYELDSGNPVIVGMDHPGHFVVATHRKGDTYYINDPWYEDGDKEKTLDMYNNDFQHLIIYHGVK
jgi:hypothetical protein